MKTLFVMQAVPGSGKSTAVNKIIKNAPRGVDIGICSADFFHMKNGVYDFKLENIKSAHQYCQATFRQYLNEGVNYIIIDNTNVKVADCRYYVENAMEKGYQVKFVRPDTPWANDVDECTKRNVHKVPRIVIANMLENLSKFDFKALGLNEETDLWYL